MRLRASRAWKAPSPTLLHRGRKYLCRAVVPDQFCFRRHLCRPSSSPQTPGTDYNSDPADETPHALISAMPSTSESCTLPTDFAESTPGLPELQIPAPTSYSCSLLAR